MGNTGYLCNKNPSRLFAVVLFQFRYASYLDLLKDKPTVIKYNTMGFLFMVEYMVDFIDTKHFF
jgi:hypothetical protein